MATLFNYKRLPKKEKNILRKFYFHEDLQMSSVSGEIVSAISDEAFRWLDAPVKRHTAKDTHIPYHPNYENDVLPTEGSIYNKVMELINF